MIKGSKEYLDDLAKRYVCKDDGGLLTVAWHAKEDSHILRCQHDHFPDEVIRNPSLTEMYRQGEELPEPIKSNVEKGIARRAAARPTPAPMATYRGVPSVDLDTGELLTRDQVESLIGYALLYGLDPKRGHIAIMHGQPYITIDGYLYHAKKEEVPFSLTGRPLTEEELKLQGYEPGDLGWYSKVSRHDTGQVFEGYGFVRKSETTEMSKKSPDKHRYPVVAMKPGNMVIKRGDWQALRRAFPIGESEPKQEA